ncbi:hypothetical protein RIF29_40442 [Crotalaria pallida]|uniref:Uncharacterized protein n=1 Tax=Crotalaria pallida TaxID=3830 RepID=A0AAN9HNG6_CROPI
MWSCETKTWLVLSLVLLVANYNQNSVLGEPQVPGLFIFGDSLSDNGNNNNLATNAKSNFKPYGIDFPAGPTGRFTNGRTIIDIISGIRIETGGHRGELVSLGLQLLHHRAIVSRIAFKLGGLRRAKQYLSKCLYYVQIGNNDYLNNYFIPEYYPTSTIYSPEQYAEALIDELALYLKALQGLGARKFVLVGLGRIGCIPFFISKTGGSCFEAANDAALIFSEKLKSLVDQFNNKSPGDSKFIFVNSTSNTLGNAVGFKDSTTACCATGPYGECIPDQTPCSNRREHVFFDQYHTTEDFNILAASAIYNSSYFDSTYPMNIKKFVEQEMKMEPEFMEEFTSLPSRFYADE